MMVETLYPDFSAEIVAQFEHVSRVALTVYECYIQYKSPRFNFTVDLDCEQFEVQQVVEGDG